MPCFDDHGLHYYVARLDACLDDPAVSDAEFRRWVREVHEDLRHYANTTDPVDDTLRAEAAQLGQATQQWVFHDGPEPDAP
ncbi:hypothetical protein SAMN00768000_3620 [Sulfobacillus thermosulfidooxidans DSM 9293]|uniref:Uncharacterized protein n=1 Tax=Sulfobacillus thermosulfidooxidans (strain DSM 9293 / VKM B-1269 / AT-1) TaxID=929705 RepID=A0A1W1WP13_SULTA|nr:hypothetical protein [Sulfobacillus thermosulfidooxidans]SMC08054.1 hypothetical protein SAMN00768000_3620 [Sulfobacillus thermosulfidooxidans DSM 9293]